SRACNRTSSSPTATTRSRRDIAPHGVAARLRLACARHAAHLTRFRRTARPPRPARGARSRVRVLSGLLAPTSGEIRLAGEPLTLARLSPQVALLSHANGLKPELTAIENL